jgi:hypothetical protein
MSNINLLDIAIGAFFKTSKFTVVSVHQCANALLMHTARTAIILCVWEQADILSGETRAKSSENGGKA